MNLNQAQTDVLLEWLYNTTGFQASSNQIQFGVPSPITPVYDNPSAVNTTVTISPATGWWGLFHDTDLLYTREDISTLTPIATAVWALPAYPFTSAELLTMINTNLGIQLLPTDLVPQTYTDNTVPVTVSIDPGCLLFQGTLSITPNPNLNLATPVSALQGFNAGM